MLLYEPFNGLNIVGARVGVNLDAKRVELGVGIAYITGEGSDNVQLGRAAPMGHGADELNGE